MADGTTNIYVDSSFISSNPNSEDVSVIFKVAEANNIGSFNVPIEFVIDNLNNSFKDINTEYTNTGTISGSNSIYTEYNNSTVVSGMEIALTDYYTGPKSDLSLDTDVQYATGFLPVSGSQDVKVNFIGANTYTTGDNVSIYYWSYGTTSGSTDLHTLYTNFSGNYDPLENPIPSLDYTHDMPTEYTNSTSISGALDETVDVTFAGWIEYAIPSDIYSVLSGTNDGFYTESTVISGGLLNNDLDIMSVLLGLDSFNNDITCSLLDNKYLDFQLSVISGTIGYFNTEIWSTVKNIDSVVCDIELYPIKISNFSLDVGEYASTGSFVSVDVTDDVYNITTSGTYFIVDGDRVPVTFSGIDDGYRMFYDPTNNFTSISGSTEIIAHAENDNGDYLEQVYYLTYGYYLKYYNKDYDKVDLGFGKEVGVRMEAEDYASCPTKGTDAYYFYTKYFQSSDLSVSIQAIRTVFNSSSNISASIYPVSTAYFYGKVFRVTVDAKDFAGNEMPRHEFEFTIEDPTNE